MAPRIDSEETVVMHMSMFESARLTVAVFLAATLAAQSIPSEAAFAQPAIDGSSSETTQPSSDIEQGQAAAFQEYLSDRSPAGWSVGWGSLGNDVGVTGGSISLLRNGEETAFSKGLSAHAPSKVTYNDIQDYGYERFESWVGIDRTARNSASKVEFKILADGEVRWSSGEMDSRSDAVFASVDLEGVKVLQLVVEAVDRGSAPYNHAIWADARFVKEEATPWLSASDKVFSIPDQVTDENILEGVFARTLSGNPGSTDAPVVGSDGTLRNGKEGNDLSDAVTYSTDYVPGQTGDFSITYRVVDALGLERTRTVKMSVQGTQRSEIDADLEFLTTPFASYLYTARDYFDEQGKKAFDLSVETLLAFGDNVESYPLISRWGEEVYEVTVRLQDAGIWMSASDAGYLTSSIMDNEPRSFHVKDWGTVVSTKDGMADTVTYYVAKRYGQKDDNGQPFYHTRLLQAEANASRFLSNATEEMTDAQRLRAVLYPYADWLKYAGGGQTMDEALAGGTSVCGGNARGSIYLCQRLGIKAYWVRTDSHAWSNVKLNHDDSGMSDGGYYRIDLLARPGCFLSIDADHQGFHGHHNAIYFNRAKGYPDMTLQSYPFEWTAWPSLVLDVEQSVVVLAPEDARHFDPRSLVKSASSIYQGSLTDSVEIDDGGLFASVDDGAFTPGFYTIEYSLEDAHGRSLRAEAYVHVVDGDVVPAGSSGAVSNEGSVFEPVSLWSGTEEVHYENGIRQNEAKSVTFDVAGKGYTHFDAWVGINGTVRLNTQYGMNGKVQLEVWARLESGEDVKLASSPIMGWYAKREHMLVALPHDAVSVTLRNVPKGSGNNHAAWGSPRFFTSEVLSEVPNPPSVLDVEHGAVYSAGVSPVVERADSIELYRKAIPVSVDPSTGQPEDEPAISALAVDKSVHEWGDLVEGYASGDLIEEEGVYTLVASNKYGQRSVVGFTILLPANAPDDPVVPDIPDTPDVPDVPDTPDVPDGMLPDSGGEGGNLGSGGSGEDSSGNGGSGGPSEVPDGKDEVVLEDGSVVKVVHDGEGEVSSVEVTVSESAAQSGSLRLPVKPVVGAVDGDAPLVSVSIPSGGTVSLVIPVASAMDTVLVVVGDDGVERVLPKTGVEDGALVCDVEDGLTYKVVRKDVSFPDLSGDEWYAESGVVDFVASRGILSGVVEGEVALFKGEASLTRGMLVTMLHRVESEPDVSNVGFSDVDQGSWYANSSAWASESGVAKGFELEDGSAIFAGDVAVTREQVATFCYRYAALLGLDTSSRASLDAFEDGDSVSSWAKDALSWAVAVGLVRGDDGANTVRPDDGASRAEASAIVMRLVCLLNSR